MPTTRNARSTCWDISKAISSSRALAALAIFGKTDLVRRAAVETVKRRKADDVLMAWIGLLRPPVKYEVRQVAGPGLPGVLFVEGDQFNVAAVLHSADRPGGRRT